MPYGKESAEHQRLLLQGLRCAIWQRISRASAAAAAGPQVCHMAENQQSISGCCCTASGVPYGKESAEHQRVHTPAGAAWLQVPPPLGIKGLPQTGKRAQEIILDVDIPLRCAPRRKSAAAAAAPAVLFTLRSGRGERRRAAAEAPPSAPPPCACLVCCCSLLRARCCANTWGCRQAGMQKPCIFKAQHTHIPAWLNTHIPAWLNTHTHIPAWLNTHTHPPARAGRVCACTSWRCCMRWRGAWRGWRCPWRRSCASTASSSKKSPRCAATPVVTAARRAELRLHHDPHQLAGGPWDLTSLHTVHCVHTQRPRCTLTAH